MSSYTLKIHFDFTSIFCVRPHAKIPGIGGVASFSASYVKAVHNYYSIVIFGHYELISALKNLLKIIII
jgi:hypothetical protein